MTPIQMILVLVSDAKAKALVAAATGEFPELRLATELEALPDCLLTWLEALDPGPDHKLYRAAFELPSQQDEPSMALHTWSTSEDSGCRDTTWNFHLTPAFPTFVATALRECYPHPRKCEVDAEYAGLRLAMIAKRRGLPRECKVHAEYVGVHFGSHGNNQAAARILSLLLDVANTVVIVFEGGEKRLLTPPEALAVIEAGH